MNNSVYVTTSIPYVNAPPHVGFALELVQADVIARWHRRRGDDVRLQTGTDENAFKNVLSARELGVSVRTLVDDNAERFRELSVALNIDAASFVRTADPAHHRAVAEFLSRLQPNDVYASEYRGRYCTACEDFYGADDLVNGCCPEHGTPVSQVAERNHFFRLTAYADRVRDLITSHHLRITPEARETEVLRFIERGLRDISLSRDAARADGWGVPYPGDASQVVYVWIDALINYVSGLGFPDYAEFGRYWNGGVKCHVIGKNVWKFHAVYWPALLLSAGLPVPDEIVVHGFLTNEGRKISKSSGDAANPIEFVNEFGADAVRHFLLRHVRPFDDTDFSGARLDAAYHSDLANGLGNLVVRLSTLCERAGVSGSEEVLPESADVVAHIEARRFDLALALIWEDVGALNREIAATKPWEDLKAGRNDVARATLEPLALRLRSVADWLTPFLPSAGVAIRSAFSAATIVRQQPLFPRLNDLERSP